MCVVWGGVISQSVTVSPDSQQSNGASETFWLYSLWEVSAHGWPYNVLIWRFVPRLHSRSVMYWPDCFANTMWKSAFVIMTAGLSLVHWQCWKTAWPHKTPSCEDFIDPFLRCCFMFVTLVVSYFSFSSSSSVPEIMRQNPCNPTCIFSVGYSDWCVLAEDNAGEDGIQIKEQTNSSFCILPFTCD